MPHMKFLLVDMKVLPEIFTKVVQAKALLAQGKAKSASEAAKQVGISRSAFYKYKESVFPYDNKVAGSIVTLSITLSDEAGALSNLITELYRAGANILTVNQNIPIDGVAPVSISVRTDALKLDIEQLLELVSLLDGVVDVKRISGQ